MSFVQLLIKKEKKDGKLTFVLGDQELHIIEASSNNRLWKQTVKKRAGKKKIGINDINQLFKNLSVKNFHKADNYSSVYLQNFPHAI